MQTILAADEIRALLPHRYPFLLVDRVVELVPGKRIVGLKNLTINESFFFGHFPEQAVMPGVLMIEALAQVAGLLAAKSQAADAEQGGLFFLVGVDAARFRRVVIPGDQLMLEAEISSLKRNIMKHTTRALVDGELACSAEIMCVRSKA